jgi:hypothetical protein
VAFKQAINASLSTSALNPDVATKAAMGMGGPNSDDTDNRKREFSADARPGVETNERGWRWETAKSREPGDQLFLFPSYRSRKSLSTEPNFGWLPNEPEDYSSFEEMLERVRNKPSVKITKYPVNPKTDDINRDAGVDIDPFSIMSGMSYEERKKRREEKKSNKNEIKTKNLGRSLKDRIPGGTLVARAAAMAGVVIDERNKFRCPPGTPAANQFTDRTGSNCFGFSPSRFGRFAAQMAREVYPEGADPSGLRGGVRGLFDFLYTGRGSYSAPEDFGRTPYFDPVTGEPNAPMDWRTADPPQGKRWIKNGFANAQDKVAANKAQVLSLQQRLGVDTSDEARRTNADLEETIEKLRQSGEWDVQLQSLTGTGGKRMTERQVEDFVRARLESTPGWLNLSKQEQDILVQADKVRYYQTERGVIEGILTQYAENPELVRNVGIISLQPMPRRGMVDEASTAFYGSGSNLRAIVNINIEEIMSNQEAMLPNMGPNERLAIAAVGTRTDAEASKAVADFLVSSDVAARAMAGMIDGAYSFAAHIGHHEIGHVLQGAVFMENIRESLAAKGYIEVPLFKRDGSPDLDSAGIQKVARVTSMDQLTGGQLIQLMQGMSKEIHPADVDDVMRRASVVSLLAGNYPDQYKADGNDPVWLLELSAELHALRSQGLFTGEDLDAVNKFLEWQDGPADQAVQRRRAEFDAAEAAREEAESFTPDEPTEVDIDPASVTPAELEEIYKDRLSDYRDATAARLMQAEEMIEQLDERQTISFGSEMEVGMLEVDEEVNAITERIRSIVGDKLAEDGSIKMDELSEELQKEIMQLQFQRQIKALDRSLYDKVAGRTRDSWQKRYSGVGKSRGARQRWDILMEDELLRAGWDRKTKKRLQTPDADSPDADVPENTVDLQSVNDSVRESLKKATPDQIKKKIINKYKERALIKDKTSDDYLIATEELDAMSNEYLLKLRASGDKRRTDTIRKELVQEVEASVRPKKKDLKKFKSRDDIKESAKKERATHRRKLTKEQRDAVSELGTFEDAEILRMLDPREQVAAGRAINRNNARLKRLGMKADPKSKDEGSLEEQVENILIPAMEAIDKTSVDQPFEMETVMEIDPSLVSGRAIGTELEMNGFTIGTQMVNGKSQIDVPKTGPGGQKARRVVVTVKAGDRGMFTSRQKGDDRDIFTMPPGRMRIIGRDPDGTVRVEFVHQSDTQEVVGKLAVTIGDGTDDAIWRKGQQKKLQKIFDRYVVSSGDRGDSRVGPRDSGDSEIRDTSTAVVDSVAEMGGSFAEPIDDLDGTDSPEAGRLSSGARQAGPTSPITREAQEAKRARLADAVQTRRLQTTERRKQELDTADKRVTEMRAAIEHYDRTGEWRGGEYGISRTIHNEDDRLDTALDLDDKTDQTNWTREELESFFREDFIQSNPGATEEQIRERVSARMSSFRDSLSRKLDLYEKEARLKKHNLEAEAQRRSQNTIDIEDLPDEVVDMLAAESAHIGSLAKEKQDQLFSTGDPSTKAVVHSGAAELAGGVIDPSRSVGTESGGGDAIMSDTAQINRNQAAYAREQLRKTKTRISGMGDIRAWLESDDDEIVFTSMDELENVPLTINGTNIRGVMQDSGRVVLRKSELSKSERRSIEDFVSEAEEAELLKTITKLEKAAEILERNDNQYMSVHSRISPEGIGFAKSPGYYGRHAYKVVPSDVAEYPLLGEMERGTNPVIKDELMERRWKTQAARGATHLVIGKTDEDIVDIMEASDERQILSRLAPVIGISTPVPASIAYNPNAGSSGMGPSKTQEMGLLTQKTGPAIIARALKQLKRDGRVDMDTVLSDPTLAPDDMPSASLSSGRRGEGPTAGSGVSRALGMAAGGTIRSRATGKVVDKILERTGADEDTKANVKVGLGLISAFGAGGPAGAATYVAVEAARRGGRDLAEFVVDELVERGRMTPEQAGRAMDAVDRIAPNGLPDGAKRKLGQAFTEAADLLERVNTPENRARLAEMSDDAIDSVVEKARSAKEGVREITDTTVESLRDLGSSARELGGSAREKLRGVRTRVMGPGAARVDGSGPKLSSGSRIAELPTPREIASRREVVRSRAVAADKERGEAVDRATKTVDGLKKALDEFERTGEWRGGDYGVGTLPDTVPENTSLEEASAKASNRSMQELMQILKTAPPQNATPEQIKEAEEKTKQALRARVEKTISLWEKDKRVRQHNLESSRLRREQGTIDIEDIPDDVRAELIAEGGALLDAAYQDRSVLDPIFSTGSDSSRVVIHQGPDTLKDGVISPNVNFGSTESGSLGGNTAAVNAIGAQRFYERHERRVRQRRNLGDIRRLLDGEVDRIEIDDQSIRADLEGLIPGYSSANTSLTRDQINGLTPAQRNSLLNQYASKEKLDRLDTDISKSQKTYDVLKSNDGQHQSAYSDPVSGVAGGYYGRYAQTTTIPKDVADIAPEWEGGVRGEKTKINDPDAYKRWQSAMRGGHFVVVGERGSEITQDWGPSDEAQIIAPKKPIIGISGQLNPGKGQISGTSSDGQKISMAIAARAMEQYRRDGRVDPETVLADRSLVPELASIDITGRSERAIEELRAAEKSAHNPWITTKDLISISTKQEKPNTKPDELVLGQETRSQRKKERMAIVGKAIYELKQIIGGATSKEFPGVTRADIDPKIVRLLMKEPLEVLNARLEKAAMRMHMGFDRRVRVRMTEDDLMNFGKTGSVRAGGTNSSSQPSRRLERLMRMDPEYRESRSARSMAGNKIAPVSGTDSAVSQGLKMAQMILESGKTLSNMSDEQIQDTFSGEVSRKDNNRNDRESDPVYLTKNRAIAVAILALGEKVELQPSSTTGKIIPQQLVSEATSGALLLVSKDSDEWRDFAEKIGLPSDERATNEEMDDALTNFIETYNINFCSMPQASGNILCISGVEVDRNEMPQLVGNPIDGKSVAGRMFIDGMLDGTWKSKFADELAESREKLRAARNSRDEDNTEHNIAIVDAIQRRVAALEQKELQYRKLSARHDNPQGKSADEVREQESAITTAIDEFEDKLSDLRFTGNTRQAEIDKVNDQINAANERLDILRSMKTGKLTDEERSWLYQNTDWSSVTVDAQPLFLEFAAKALDKANIAQSDPTPVDPLDLQPTQLNVSATKVNEYAQNIFMEVEIISDILKAKGLYPGTDEYAAALSKELMDNPIGTRIVVARNGQIIDGHHKWAATIMVNESLPDNEKLPILVSEIDADVITALSLAKVFQTAMGIATPDTKKREWKHDTARPIGEQEVKMLVNSMAEDASSLVNELHEDGHFIKIAGVGIPASGSTKLAKTVEKMRTSADMSATDSRSAFETGLGGRNNRTKQRTFTGDGFDNVRKTKKAIESSLKKANLTQWQADAVRQAAYFVLMMEKEGPAGMVSEAALRISRIGGRGLAYTVLNYLNSERKIKKADVERISAQVERGKTRSVTAEERSKLVNAFRSIVPQLKTSIAQSADAEESMPTNFDDRVRAITGRRTMRQASNENAGEDTGLGNQGPRINSFMRKHYAKIGIPVDAPEDVFPVHGYVVHKSHVASRLNAAREKGMGNIEETAVFEISKTDPSGDGLPAYGEVEVVLRKPVSSRAAYSLGQSMAIGSTPVKLNSTVREDIADAFYSARNPKGKWANLDAIIGLLMAEITNDYNNVNTTVMGDEPSNRVFEALVLGGFDKDEVAQINYPYSRITELAEAESVGNLISDKEIRTKLAQAGLIPEEIEYVMSMPSSQKKTKAEREIREYLAAQKVKQRLNNLGFENVKIAHPDGFDLDDPRTYSRGARRGDSVMAVLKNKMLTELTKLGQSSSNEAKKDESSKIVKRQGQQA